MPLLSSKEWTEINMIKPSVVYLMLKVNGYDIDEYGLRRLHHYEYEDNTQMRIQEDRLIISTETNIKGIYNTLLFFPNGKSKVQLDFDDPMK